MIPSVCNSLRKDVRETYFLEIIDLLQSVRPLKHVDIILIVRTIKTTEYISKFVKHIAISESRSVKKQIPIIMNKFLYFTI